MSGPAAEAKHGKSPAPTKPPSAEDRVTLEGKSAPSAAHRTSLERKQAPSVHGLNPFEDDMDDSEFAEAKVRSAKKTRAPPLPTNAVEQNSSPTADVVQNSAPETKAREARPAAAEKKEGPPPATRR